MSPPEQQRVRARKPKTKTGCKTCKLRRVKCDEGKPLCLRCLNFGVECDGYDSILKGSTIPRRTSAREIVPRTNTRNATALLAPSIMKHPFATFFKDGREYMYFLNYQEEAALELSGPFDARLWSGVVLQACHSEPSLCRLTAAIGALNRANRLRALSFYDEEARSHERYALREYGRALKGIQDMISDPRHQNTARIALIASLLIYCFENLHGDHDMAIMHMESALHLMNKQLSQTTRHYKHLQNISPTPDLEDDLVTAFIRLDSQLLSRPDNSDTKSLGSETVRNSILNHSFSEEAYNVPYRFHTINQARSYLEYMQFGALPSLAHEFSVQFSGSPDTISQYAKDLCTAHSKQFTQWRSAFAPLYAEACKPGSGKDFVAAATLRVSGLSTEITAQRMAIREKSSWDLFKHESREIINLSRLVIADSSFRKVFVFDCGIVPGLFIVVVICENIQIRREAMRVLRTTVPRREGAWDSVTLVQIGDQILAKAEAALEGMV